MGIIKKMSDFFNWEDKPIDTTNRVDSFGNWIKSYNQSDTTIIDRGDCEHSDCGVCGGCLRPDTEEYDCECGKCDCVKHEDIDCEECSDCGGCTGTSVGLLCRNCENDGCDCDGLE
jgi:hypothetical protein